MENEDYFYFKNRVQKDVIQLDNDFWNYRLKPQDEKIFNINYGMKAWYSGFYIESFRNSYKAYLQAKDDGDEERKSLTLCNIRFCDEKWNNEKIEFLKKESFFQPYHHYLKKSDLYVFTSHSKNVLKEFIWKVCYHASIVNPRWKIIFMLIDGEEINLYFEEKDNLYYKYIPNEKNIESEGDIKLYLSLERDEKFKDKNNLIALANFIVTNSSYYI